MVPAPPNSQAAPLPVNLPFRLVSKTIGQGAYASIRKAVPLNAPKPIIAIKFINKDHAFRHGRLTQKLLSMEITLHKHLGKHQNIIQCLASGEDTLWTWIAMELADGGDLFDKIEADVGVGEDIAHFYFTQMVSAVAFMHSRGIAHRDIKPENVLLSAEGDLKIADFGLAALFKRGDDVRLCNTVCGSPPYIAPEIVSGRRSARADLLDKGYRPDICDIWSCGIVLFVLLVGNTPWDEPTMRSEEYKEYVESEGHTTDELWQQLPPAMISLLRGMLRLDPATRFTLDEVRQHPWYTRRNPFLSSSGRSANPLGLATQMLSQLHIDFNQQPSQSQRSNRFSQASQAQDPDAMDVDSSPRRSSAGAHSHPTARDHFAPLISSTQPETPTAETPFDWERPPRLSTHDGVPASQPQTGDQYNPTYQMAARPTLSQFPNSTQEFLSQDPSLTQFSQRGGEVPMTLTQAARQFKDVLPSHSLARFLSPLSISLLVPHILQSLHQLGIPTPNVDERDIANWERSGEASIRVKMADGRRQGLNGHIVVERIEVGYGEMMSEVRFVKASGDPLEWRRFFKNVVVTVGDAVVVRPDT